jgi:uncharacterized phiE125 gp8 family phage protein
MNYRSLTRQTTPATEPVTLAEAKHHCRVDSTADDAYLTALISTVRAYAESYCDMTFVGPSQYVMKLDTFPAEIRLPRPPMFASGTATAVEVTYSLNDTGAQATLPPSEYRVDREAIPGTIRPPYGGTWPSYRADYSSITVRWWAGPSSPEPRLKAAILMIVDHLYRQRSAVESMSMQEVPLGAKALLDSIKWGAYR